MQDRRTVIKGAVAAAAAAAAAPALAQEAARRAGDARGRPFLTEDTLREIISDPGRSRSFGAGLARNPKAHLAQTFRLTPDQIETIGRMSDEQLINLGKLMGAGVPVDSARLVGSGSSDTSGAPTGKTKSLEITFKFTF